MSCPYFIHTNHVLFPQVNFQNTRLKRQSQQLLDTVVQHDLRMEDLQAITEDTTDEDMVDDPNKHWNDMIEGTGSPPLLLFCTLCWKLNY